MFNEDMSVFWSSWIAVITLGVIAFCWWLLYGNRKTDSAPPSADGEAQTTGHVADGIEEYDNPLPRWWFIMFVGTIVFGLGYLALYPGLGNFKGLLGWSSTGQWEDEMAHAEEFYAPVFKQYAEIDIETLAQDPEAMRVAGRIFQNNCAICHGSSATGGFGFPDLTDKVWIYGGSPEDIRASIMLGRNGIMPSWDAMLNSEQVSNVANYVLSLSGLEHDAAKVQEAAPMFQAICSSCHGSDGKGSAAMGRDSISIGAPDLTANTWLYQQPGESVYDSVSYTIRHGRNGLMPAQARYLDYDADEPVLPKNYDSLNSKEKEAAKAKALAIAMPKLHLVTAYIYSLNQGK